MRKTGEWPKANFKPAEDQLKVSGGPSIVFPLRLKEIAIVLERGPVDGGPLKFKAPPF
jgi:hypothetical protein